MSKWVQGPWWRLRTGRPACPYGRTARSGPGQVASAELG
jgi:hypothetical protein